MSVQHFEQAVTPGNCTPYTSALNNFFSGVNISKFIPLDNLLVWITACLGLQFLAFFDGVVDAPYQVKGCFGIFVHFAVHDHVETTDRFVDGNQHAFETGELFSHVEGLGQETLYLTGAGNGHFIFVAQFVQTEDGDDILQFLIALEDQLYIVGAIVVRVADDQRGEDTGGGIQGIHGRIDTQDRRSYGSVRWSHPGGRRS
jgi:hypothetical protein